MAGRAALEALSTFRPPAKAETAWRDLVSLLDATLGETTGWPEQFDLVRQWYQPNLDADDIEEERRLLYVAMTRAKDQLALIVPHRFYVHGQARGGDKHVYASRSRFIPASVAETFETVSWSPAIAGPSSWAAGTPVVNLAARMRGKWRN
jgi:hypothetical protein